MQQKIGFIGLGIMGRPMATHLLNAGYPLVVHDHGLAKMQALAARGATLATSCREVAQQSDVIISMLPDSANVEAAALGKDGIREGARAGQVYVDMSTIAPQTAIQVADALAAKGVRCLDAPVSGGEIGAQNATLSIMVGGSAELLEEMLPILQVLGKTITHCGKSGAGQIVKACNQIQVALNLLGMAEALVLGTKAGVDPGIILQVLGGGYAQTRVMDVRGPKVLAGDFAPGFKSKLHFKDLSIARATARDLKVSIPATVIAHELFGALVAQGRGDLDHSAVITLLEDQAGVAARTQE